jgi:IS1 family transposase
MGKRDQSTCDVFVEGLCHATARTSFQITTDGFAPYCSAITTTLHDRLTGYAMLIKVYRSSQDGEARYSPAEVASTEVVPIMGQPDPERICTSIVERSNLSLRMGLRRFTRLTNGFRKKWENHWAAVILWYTWYNFGRVHKSLRMTPAMEAGIADHVWSVREILEVA